MKLTTLQIKAAPLPHWRNLSHRRLQTYPSPLTPQNTLLASLLPAWLSDPIIPRLLLLPLSVTNPKNIFSDSPHRGPNHVLVNEYKSGQGILPHEDGGAYWPVVATVSLGSAIVLDVYSKKQDENREREDLLSWKILQERKSLLITTGALYSDYLHGITEMEFDEGLSRDVICNWDLLRDKEAYEGTVVRGTRFSLTFRDVMKVKKLGKGLDFLGKRVQGHA